MSELFISGNMLRRDGVLTVKLLGDKYKITWNRSVRKKGYELSEAKKEQKADFDKRGNNISRARSLIFEYAYCNQWDYFVTLTINEKKYDRYDLKEYIKALGKFINNYHTNHHSKLSYLLIPERHKDGAWHMHGLISGILPKHLIINKNGYLDFPLYANKFGYFSASTLRSHEAVSRYITKYVTKELASLPYGQHLYYCSHGLKKAEKLYEFDGVDPSCIEWDYKHPDGFCFTAIVGSLDFLADIYMI